MYLLFLFAAKSVIWYFLYNLFFFTNEVIEHEEKSLKSDYQEVATERCFCYWKNI